MEELNESNGMKCKDQIEETKDEKEAIEESMEKGSQVKKVLEKESP
jgi:hypothetical protein